MNKEQKIIVLGPSGSGKTTFAALHQGDGVVDADRFAYKGLKLDHEWWAKATAPAIHTATQAAVERYDGPGDIILWATKLEGDFAKLVDAVVVPKLADYVRNMNSRRDKQSPSRIGVQPVFDDAKAAAVLAEHEAFARANGIPIFAEYGPELIKAMRAKIAGATPKATTTTKRPVDLVTAEPGPGPIEGTDVV